MGGEALVDVVGWRRAEEDEGREEESGVGAAVEDAEEGQVEAEVDVEVREVRFVHS